MSSLGMAAHCEQRSGATGWRAGCSRILPVAVAALFGLVVTATTTLLVARWERHVTEQEFVSVSEDHLLILQNGWNEYLGKLVALRALFESSDEVTREEFALFTRRLLHGQPAIQNFAWVPRVLKDERAEHERAAGRDGIFNYQIKALAGRGRTVPAPVQDDYLPIFYSTLPKDNVILGLDLYSTIPQPLSRAWEHDQLSCVPNWILNSADGFKRGILFSLPVYRRGSSNLTVEDRRRNLVGFVHGSFIISELVAQVINTSTIPQGIDIHLFAADAGPMDAPLYVHWSRLRALSPQLEPKSVLLTGPHWHGEISAGDARWLVVTTPLSPGPLTATRGHAWTVFGAGLLLTFAFAAYMAAAGRHARRLLAANRKVADLAQRDPLTGLANRRFFFECLETAFAAYKHGGLSFAVLYFDVDHFKDVNDTLGHPVGDKLLQLVADRVRNVVRATDVVARFGGDEFAILQRDVSDLKDARTLASKIAAAVSIPYSLNGSDIHVTASIGIARATLQATDPDTLMIQADLALYRAKGDGRNRFRVHSSDLDRQVRERVSISDDLRQACQRGELALHYQPQVEVGSGRIVGAEALLRWRHPQRGMIPPGTFIPVAEMTGLIVPLGEWAFEEACRQLRAWLDDGIAPDAVAVNVSAAQFKFGAELESSIEESLARWRIPRGCMEIELTESVLMDVTEQHKSTLDRLRGLGLRVAIDDFGTGYSSLNYLTFYPVNRLKIAQELVFRVTTDSRNATVVHAATRLADDLGIECIAEGVETAAQAAFLESAGCRYAQGYHFSRPVDAAEMTRLLRRRVIGPGNDASSGIEEVLEAV
jgi:diguanylate cyclase (GGDEF)-like protein